MPKHAAALSTRLIACMQGRLGFSMRLVTGGYIQRGAAILLLLFVVADITSSEVCGEKLELLGFPNSCIATFASSNASRRTIPAAIRHSQRNESSQSLPEDVTVFAGVLMFYPDWFSISSLLE